ncbi:hypothetical protein F511_38076 [Dorcoceras hygrometricum]|uniref:Uncharacterized protein n=1 Tax=Dorcoceras hygrometricum TaxID=472368 RepID=A0A2Z7A9P5_9LAMI|nr:hypothetical protein F511_38076 [Dorcoceras hygrometricum]
MNSNARKEHEEQQEPEITANGKDGSPYVSIPTILVNGEGNVDDQHISTGSQEPENVVAQMGDNPTSVEEYFQMLFASAWDNISEQMTMFDKWMHFRQEEGSTRRFDGYRPSANTQSPSLAQGELLATPITKQSQLLNTSE